MAIKDLCYQSIFCLLCDTTYHVYAEQFMTSKPPPKVPKLGTINIRIEEDRLTALYERFPGLSKTQILDRLIDNELRQKTQRRSAETPNLAERFGAAGIVDVISNPSNANFDRLLETANTMYFRVEELARFNAHHSHWLYLTNRLHYRQPTTLIINLNNEGEPTPSALHEIRRFPETLPFKTEYPFREMPTPDNHGLIKWLDDETPIRVYGYPRSGGVAPLFGIVTESQAVILPDQCHSWLTHDDDDSPIRRMEIAYAFKPAGNAASLFENYVAAFEHMATYAPLDLTPIFYGREPIRRHFRGI